MIDVSAVKQAATNYRTAIEIIGGTNLEGRFSNFPAGACGDCSYLLGAYLSELRLGCFDYVCGHKGMQSHAWLERDGIIVDITSDQFEGGQRVYVGRKNAFYRQFLVDFRHAWYASLDGESIETDRLYPTYKVIMSKVNEHD